MSRHAAAPTGAQRRALLACVALPWVADPALATPESLRAAVAEFTAGAGWREGRVALEIETLVENGNVVPVSVSVDSAMSGADRVLAIGLFTERNPLPEVAVFQLGPAVARARVSTRMRLATTGRVLALARMADGRCWGAQLEVIVTLAACIES